MTNPAVEAALVHFLLSLRRYLKDENGALLLALCRPCLLQWLSLQYTRSKTS
jgi:hypothetical protein